jgi:hypothetical protein
MMSRNRVGILDITAAMALTVAVSTLSGQTPSGQAQDVPTFAGNAQHTSVYLTPAANLNAIRWTTSIDLRQTFGTTHYGAPLVTPGNTIVVPVKTQTDGFQIRLLDASTGQSRGGTLGTDYLLPAHNWIPVYNPALATIAERRAGVVVQRLYFPGAGGTLFYVTNPDSPRRGTPVRVAFYGLDAYRQNTNAFNQSVFVNTPLTTDRQGNVFFGFRVQGSAPSPLDTTQSGFARIAPDGTARYVLAGPAAGDGTISRDSHNSAPALSNDGRILYVVVKSGTTNNYGYLLGLDSTTLETRHRVFLRDPRNNRINNAGILDDSTASPMVAPDGDVYLGVFANPNNGSRGFLLRFSGDLTVEKTPGAFGWDSTPAVVPASMVPSYPGPSSYLIFTKYNNYAFSDGDGVNRIALLDPNTTQIDPHTTAGGLVVMREVLTVMGPTPDTGAISPVFPNAVREWCINTAAVNPPTKSIFVPSEDGRLYRWDLSTNSLSQGVALTPGFGEPYVPTIVGPDGTVFTLNGGTLFAVGANAGPSLTLSSSSPDLRDVVVGQSLTFTARVLARGSSRRIAAPRGTVTFRDTFYRDQVAGALSNELARVPVVNGLATYTSSSLASGTHLITATHQPSSASVTFVQKIHPYATTMSVSASGSGTVTITATVTGLGIGTPTGMVTFQEGPAVLAQLPLDRNGVAVLTTSALGPGTHAVTATYASDPLFASSRGNVTIGAPPESAGPKGPAYERPYTPLLWRAPR